MDGNKLVEITPKEWGLLVYLSEVGIIYLDNAKAAMKDVSKYRIVFAEKMLKNTQKLMADESTDRLIINRSYYCMYHASRASVYVQMPLNVTKRQLLIAKFKKLLIRTFNDSKLSGTMDDRRMNRNEGYSVHSRLFDKFLELGIDVPLSIARA